MRRIPPTLVRPYRVAENIATGSNSLDNFLVKIHFIVASLSVGCLGSLLLAGIFVSTPANALARFGEFSLWQWPANKPKVLYVCWENPVLTDKEDRALVRQAVEDTWQAYSQLRFSGWQKCASHTRGIHILIVDSAPHTKALGRALDGKQNGMVLNFTFDNWCDACKSDEETRRRAIKLLAVHQFGHALGFAHEHNRPDTPTDCTTLAQGPDPEKLLTLYDRNSVMNYCNPVWNNNGQLSELDIHGLAQVYGAASANIISRNQPWVIGWKSLDDIPRDIGQQITDLYLILFNLARLPYNVIPVKVIEEIDVENIFRKQNLFFGDDFPVELHALACDLNPETCHRERQIASTEVLHDFTANLGGYLPSSGQWRALQDGVLKFPDITFTRGFDLRKVNKFPGETITSIIERLEGCARIDKSCLNFVQRLNRNVPYADPDYHGPIQVPALALTAVIDTSCSQGNCAGGFNLETARVVAKRLGTQPPLTRPESSAKAPPGVPKTISGSKLVREPRRSVQRLLPHLWSGVDRILSLSAYDNPLSMKGESLFNDQRVTLEFIKFPWLEDPYPILYKKKVEIGVLEVNIGAPHCDLPTDARLKIWSVRESAVSITASNPKYTRINQSTVPECSNKKPPRGKAYDHGMHVLGLIGARMNGSGVVGLNPYATIHAINYVSIRLKEKSYQNALAAEIENLIFRENVRVINMSFKYEPTLNTKQNNEALLQPTTDRLQGIIAKSPHVLFVAAAGQSHTGRGRDMSRFCNVYPACLDYSNLITVVALDGKLETPTVASWAHYGEQLGIGAPGKEIVSTGSTNNFVLLDGSSQSAPQVTAVASLLFAIMPNASPEQVKNRLAACAEPKNTLERKVWSGLLDATCSLDQPDYSRIILKDASDGPIHGRIKGAFWDDSPTDRFIFYDQEADEEIRPKWANVYAIRRDPSGFNRIILFTHERPNNPATSELIRRPRLVLAPKIEQSFIFEPANGAEYIIQLKNVADFVAQMVK